MDKPLCCFIDPEYSDEPRSLYDLCPTCQRPFGFPLFNAPPTIRDFTVISGLNRGFYSAVFHVTHGTLEAPYVLKVASKAIYEKFAEYGKDFQLDPLATRDGRDQSGGSCFRLGTCFRKTSRSAM